MISKRHCSVLIKGGQVFVQDFDSTNGTFINDEQIKGEVQVKDGDTLKLGPLSFKLVIEGMPAPSKPTPPPKPKLEAALSDEDAAAAMLSVDEETGEVSATSTATSGDEIPGGSTVMEIPAFAATQEAAKEEKPEEKKPDPKKKPATGAAQNAAQAILDKLRQGKRK
jgi:pSer/pThr/pTyr-binding forkhead associated (FHA) protein